jgi:hypothetical protein
LRTPSIEISDDTEDGEVREHEREEDLRPTTSADDHPNDPNSSTLASRHTDNSYQSERDHSPLRAVNYRRDQSPHRPEDNPFDDVPRPSAAESNETSPDEDHFSQESPWRQQDRYRRNQRSPVSFRGNHFRGFRTGSNLIDCTAPDQRFPPSRVPRSPSIGPVDAPPRGRRNGRTVSSIAFRICDKRPGNRESFRQFDSPRKESWTYRSRHFNNHMTGKGYDSYRPQRRSGSQDAKCVGREERYERKKGALEIERRD